MCLTRGTATAGIFTVTKVIGFEYETDLRYPCAFRFDGSYVSDIPDASQEGWNKKLEAGMVYWFSDLLADLGCSLFLVDDWKRKHNKYNSTPTFNRKNIFLGALSFSHVSSVQIRSQYGI